MLFLEYRDYAAAITLACAAEEVLGKEVNRRGRLVALDRRVIWYAARDRKDAIAEANRVRNALKHFGDHEQSDITADLEEAARWMLERACENAHQLELEVPRSAAFGEWYHKMLSERHAARQSNSPQLNDVETGESRVVSRRPK